ncbi:hypothetical protein IGI04_011250, partial [Brassica rapa subsp. trilocularis]
EVMISELGKRPMLRDSSFGDDYEKEIGALLGEQRRRQEEADELKKELNLYRSGSVLWTVPLAPLPEGFSAAEGPVKMLADDLDAEEATHVPGNDNVVSLSLFHAMDPRHMQQRQHLDFPTDMIHRQASPNAAASAP